MDIKSTVGIFAILAFSANLIGAYIAIFKGYGSSIRTLQESTKNADATNYRKIEPEEILHLVLKNRTFSAAILLIFATAFLIIAAVVALN